jgi:pantetheine-phosphate adenylyltransferase
MHDYEPFVAAETDKLIAVYPGTFDPITMGHLDIIDRSLNLFDKVIITIATNTAKKPLFTVEERLAMIRECFPASDERLEFDTIDGLLVDYAYTKGAKAIIRGLRAVSDFDYEFQLALMNRKLERDVDTLFLMPGLRWIFISSSIIKDAARHGGDISDMVPVSVSEKLRKKFAA